MIQNFRAVYQQGVLKPLEPVLLKEDEVVSISLRQDSDIQPEQLADTQREAILRFAAKVEESAEPADADGLTNRDHDRLIYGN